MARKKQKPIMDKAPYKRVTVSDIAHEAGVSKATVSLVLSGRKELRISEATSERVRKIARDLGFIPSRLGKGFLQGNSRIIGAVMQYTQYSPWLEAYAAIQDELAHEGYVAIALMPTWQLCLSDGRKRKTRYVSTELESLRSLLEYQIDGLLYYSLNPEQASEVLEEVERYRIPTVILGNRPPKTPYDFVGVDEKESGCLAAKHLMSLGIKSFAVIEYDAHFPVAERRRNAFVAELKKAGHACTVLPMEKMEGLAQLCPEHSPVGVFALNDIFASMAVQFARKRRWRVPEDMAVVGLGDLTLAQNNAVPLATVDRHSYQVASQAVKFLLERVKGYDGPPRNILFSPTLVVRESAEPTTKRRKVKKEKS